MGHLFRRRRSASSRSGESTSPVNSMGRSIRRRACCSAGACPCCHACGGAAAGSLGGTASASADAAAMERVLWPWPCARTCCRVGSYGACCTAATAASKLLLGELGGFESSRLGEWLQWTECGVTHLLRQAQSAGLQMLMPTALQYARQVCVAP
jgi:hypothetical protein